MIASVFEVEMREGVARTESPDMMQEGHGLSIHVGVAFEPNQAI